MTAILGVSAFYHDSAAALVVDGTIVAAAQEESFTRIKHDPSFPHHAIDYCLREAGLSPGELDYVGFYDKPLLKFERLLETYLAIAPRGFRSFFQFMPGWLREKLHVSRALHRKLRGYGKRFVFPEHHESHAASAFFPSPFDRAAILTVDGVGEWATTTLGAGDGNRIQLTHEERFPHSLGMLYSAFTYFCGFRVNSGEYKLMGLAPYGRPVYRELILDRILDLKEDGSFRLNMEYFNYCGGLTMTSPRFEHLFGGQPRLPESELTEREMDLAASIQVVTEEALLRMARHLARQTGERNLCLAGGVALNCVANGRLLKEGPFENIWIQPAAGDAGGALGTAFFIAHQLLDHPRTPTDADRQRGSFLGPSFSSAEVRNFLEQQGVSPRTYASESQLIEYVSTRLAKGDVVGWFQGRAEFGPRALGARSILGDPRDPEMQSRMNLKIKFRESFRPFAPAVLRERVHDYFDLPADYDSPYMLMVARVAPRQRVRTRRASHTGSRLDLRNQVRSTIPAVTHVDDSARIQTVDAERNPRFERLLKAFEAKTGTPVLINTSFNVRGEPIVLTPEDAWRCFCGTGIDLLVLGDLVVHKDDHPELTSQAPEQSYHTEFALD